MDNARLFTAIKSGETEVVLRYLGEHPELVDVPNLAARTDESQWEEISPIHVAAKYGHLDMVKGLVELGATVYSHPFCSYPAVAVAAWAKQEAVVRYFMDEIPEKADGTNRIGIACNLAGRFGWLDVVKKHLKADPFAVYSRGWIGDTVLHWPAHNGFVEIVRLLLDHGADPNGHEIGLYGGTPLHWAAERHAEIAGMLIDAGADPNARVELKSSDFYGATPLIWCATQKDDAGDVAAELLHRGADPDLRDANGKSAHEHARERNNERILAVLDSRK